MMNLIASNEKPHTVTTNEVAQLTDPLGHGRKPHGWAGPQGRGATFCFPMGLWCVQGVAAP